EGTQGWAATTDLIVFDIDRLRPQSIVLIPITPTPAGIGTAQESAGADGQAPATAGSDTAAEPGKGDVLIPGLRPTPAAENGEPTARVTVTEGRLNVRAGPGASYH